MGAQFRCDNLSRRLTILDPPPGGATLNGIDYLDVLDNDAPAGTPRQQTLLVRMFRTIPVALGKDNVVIRGGVRELDVGVVWAQRADSITIPGEPAAFYAGLDLPDQTLVVRTDKAGDFSTYTLSIVAPPPPLAFDPILSSVDFSFKVQCPSPFDCAPEEVCPPERAELPAIDYLAKDYASFRRVMLDRLAVIAPGWQQRSPADLGIAVVEAIAYAADHLSYYQDAVATEAYLGTSRRRISVRRHVRLLDYRLHEGTNARAWLFFEAASDGVLVQTKVGATRTLFLTRCVETPLVAPSEATNVIDRYQPRIFEPMHELALYRSHNAIKLWTWGNDLCCLPRGATRATLVDDPANRLRLAPGDVVVFEEIKGSATGLEADADPTRRHAVRLTLVDPPAAIATTGLRTPSAVPKLDPLFNQAIVEIEWHADDALPVPFCVSTEPTEGVNKGTVVRDLSLLRANLVLVDHGRTFAGEPLDPATVSAATPYRPRLAELQMTHSVPYDDEVARATWSATRTVDQDPHRAVPLAALESPDATPWGAKPDLLESNQFSTDFVVEMEDSGEAFLRFGDGTLGEPPVDGMTATYRIGRGRDGNVGAGSIAHAVHPNLDVSAIRNPLPAVGGVDPEKLIEAKLYAPQAFRTQERAVTEADYAAVAERHPEIQKAVATRRWTGSWYTMFITVDRKGGKPVDAAFAAELRDFIERFRLAAHDLEIDAPRFVSLDVRLVICVKPGYFKDRVRSAIGDAFSTNDLAGGTRGFFHPDNFTFGQPVYLSQLVGRAMQIPGVDWVDPTDTRFLFQRFGEQANNEIANGLIPMARLEIAQLENSRSFPENGRLDVVLMGGA